MTDTTNKDDELLQKVVRMIELKETRLRGLLIKTGRDILDVAVALRDGSMAPEVASDALIEVVKMIADEAPGHPKRSAGDDYE